MEPQPKPPAVSRVRQWRYHTAVQAARMLNAVADPDDREDLPPRATAPCPPGTFARGAGPAPSGA